VVGPEASGIEAALDAWLAPFLDVLGRKTRRRWAPLYLHGLLGPDGRKSLQPLAMRLGLGSHDPLQHFIASPAWDDAPLRRVLARKADALVGGPGAVLVVDDTACPKKGKHSVGVARQYCGALGKQANCQVLVSLTLARDEAPLPVGLRLFLPDEWVADRERCARAGVPEEHRRALAKTDIALAEIDRVLAAGVRFGRVLADAGYGASAAFRQGLSARGLTWAVGVLKTQNVYLRTVELLWPVARTGRPRKQPVPSEAPVPVEAMLEEAKWRRISWRRGTMIGRADHPFPQGRGPRPARGAARGRIRRPTGAAGRGRAAPQWLAPAWRGGLARGRASDLGRAQVLSRQPAGRDAAGGAGGGDQGALGLRAGAPAAQGGAGPRPFRRALLDRPAPARAHDHDRVRLPPAPTARGTGEKQPRTTTRTAATADPAGRSAAHAA
jgi:SRSO17 transposase